MARKKCRLYTYFCWQTYALGLSVSSTSGHVNSKQLLHLLQQMPLPAKYISPHFRHVVSILRFTCTNICQMLASLQIVSPMFSNCFLYIHIVVFSKWYHSFGIMLISKTAGRWYDCTWSCIADRNHVSWKSFRVKGEYPSLLTLCIMWYCFFWERVILVCCNLP